MNEYLHQKQLNGESVGARHKWISIIILPQTTHKCSTQNANIFNTACYRKSLKQQNKKRLIKNTYTQKKLRKKNKNKRKYLIIIFFYI